MFQATERKAIRFATKQATKVQKRLASRWHHPDEAWYRNIDRFPNIRFGREYRPNSLRYVEDYLSFKRSIPMHLWAPATSFEVNYISPIAEPRVMMTAAAALNAALGFGLHRVGSRNEQYRIKSRYYKQIVDKLQGRDGLRQYRYHYWHANGYPIRSPRGNPRHWANYTSVPRV